MTPGIDEENEKLAARYADEDFADELECTLCGGEGTCDDGSDPLGNCPDTLHRCDACGGSGKRSDQRIF